MTIFLPAESPAITLASSIFGDEREIGVSQSMPLYEYHCDSCKADVEILVRSLEQCPECPECGSPKLTKQLSVAAAPSVSGNPGNLPVAGTSPMSNCGRPQCGSGCMGIE